MESSTDISEIEKAVCTALDPSSFVTREQRLQAQAFCENFRTNPHCVEISCTLFRKRSQFPFFPNQSSNVLQDTRKTLMELNEWKLEVRYFLVQVILKHYESHDHDQETAKALVQSYVMEILLWRAQQFCTVMKAVPIHKRHAVVPDAPAVLKLMSVLYFRALIPEAEKDLDQATKWLISILKLHRPDCETFQHDLLWQDNHLDNVMQYLALSSFFCEFWKTFNEEILETDIDQNRVTRNNRIKDILRQGHILETCEMIHSLLMDLHVLSPQNQEASVVSFEPLQFKLMSDLLLMLSQFIGWVDTHVIAHEANINLVFNLLHRYPHCRSTGIIFLHQLFIKPMEPLEKLSMILKLHLHERILSLLAQFPVLESCENLPECSSTICYQDSIPVNVSIILGLVQLMNLMGCQWLSLLKQLKGDREKFTKQSHGMISGIPKAGISPFHVTLSCEEEIHNVKIQITNMLNMFLPHFLSFYKTRYLVSAVIPFFHDFLSFCLASDLTHDGPTLSEKNSLGIFTLEWSQMLEIYSTLLQHTWRHVELHSKLLFDPNNTEDDEVEHIKFRQEFMAQIYQLLYKVDQESCLRFLDSLTLQLQVKAMESSITKHDQESSVDCILYFVCKSLHYQKDLKKKAVDVSCPLRQYLQRLFLCPQLVQWKSPIAMETFCDLVDASCLFLFDSSWLGTEAEQCLDNIFITLTDANPQLNQLRNPQRRVSVVLKTLLQLTRHWPIRFKYGSRVLTFLSQIGVFSCLDYFASLYWCDEIQTKEPLRSALHGCLAQMFYDQDDPISLPNGLLTFEDQNKAFELTGLIVSGRQEGTETKPEIPTTQTIHLVEEIFNNLLTPFDTLPRSDSVLQTWFQQDVRGGLFHVKRLMSLLSFFLKRFAAERFPDFSKVTQRCVNAMRFLLENGMHSPGLRSTLMVLLQRLAFLCPKAMVDHLPALLVGLFDATFLACKNLWSNQGILNQQSPDVVTASQHLDLSTAGGVSNFCLPCTQACVEVSQLLECLSHLVCLVNKNEVKTLSWLNSEAYNFTFRLSSFTNSLIDPSSITISHPTPPHKNLPLVLRLLSQCGWFFTCVHYDTSEPITQKERLHITIYTTLSIVFLNIPQVMFELLERPFSAPHMNILEWLLEPSKKGSQEIKVDLLIECLKAWCAFYHEALQRVIHLEDPLRTEILFQRLGLTSVISVVLQQLYRFNIHSGQQQKVLRQVYLLFQSLKTPHGNSHQDSTLPQQSIPWPGEQLKQLLVYSLPQSLQTMVETQGVVDLLLTSKENFNPTTAQNILLQWLIKIQQEVLSFSKNS